VNEPEKLCACLLGTLKAFGNLCGGIVVLTFDAVERPERCAEAGDWGLSTPEYVERLRMS
jgi:hypothetical protein